MNADREHRDRLADAINRYLDEETTAFQFDDELHDIRCATEDPTVEYVADALWYHYDDCDDHKVVLSKEEWDYFQRLILLLKSDSQIELGKCKRWSFTQLVAGIALVLFGACVAWLGFGYHLLAVSVPFGVVSIFLSYLRRHLSPEPSDQQMALIPFSSVSQLMNVRRRVSTFAKGRYPSYLKSRRIRSPLMHAAVMLQSYSAWLLFSPLVLIFQMLPETDTQPRILTP